MKFMKELIACIPLLISGALFSQSSKATLVEKVEKKPGELVIPFEKYVFENGLTLIIHEDHSDPVCHVDVTYHVGSNREQVGRSGFAHFFEHMMFQGSDHVGDNEHFKIVSEAGGTLNGNTTNDRTKYFETVPSNQLETALWLEADRMGFLLDAVTQKKFEIQRSTVKNERGQNYDNRPYGLVNEKTQEALFPVGHPYSWTTIGYIEDLNRVDVSDLKKFFLRWYGPNNAVLTVAGDVNVPQVLAMVGKYFGSIPKGPEVKPVAKQPAVLDKDRYISYEDKIRFPLLYISYPGVCSYDADEAPLDILASVLSDGKSSLFYQTFIKSKIALRAEVSNPASEVAGQFTIQVLPFPGKSLSQIDSMIRATLIVFEQKGITDDDLNRFKATHESRVINSLNSVKGKATQLADYQTFAGDANYIGKDLERYNKVTKEDVMRVYIKYIKNKPAVYLSVYPKGQSQMVAKPDNYEIPKRDVAHVTESAEYAGLSYNKAKDTFDRSIRPTAGPAPVIKVPDFWKEKFENGLAVIGTKNDEIPTVTIQLSMDAGHRYEPIEKAGLAMLTANMMNESTEKHSAEEINQLLDRLGSSIEINSGENSITITINSLKKNLDATLKIAEEMVLQPKFSKEDFEIVKNEQLQLIANQSTQATVIASNVFNAITYGPGSVLSLPSIGKAATVEKLTADDVKNYYHTSIAPTFATLVMVGDVDKMEFLNKISFLKKWNAVATKRVVQEPKAAVSKTRLYFVNKEHAPQSVIQMGYLALQFDVTGDYFKSVLMNFTLGQAFNSRINLNLREAKGWTYGARANFNGSKFIGPYIASAAVRADVTDSAVAEFVKEIKGYAEQGITEKELEFTKLAIGQSEALRYETPGQKAQFLKRILDYNLEKTFVDQQNTILKNITKNEIDALAKKYLEYNAMNIVVVGDKAKVFDGLKKLGYDVLELDTDGNPAVSELPPVPVQGK